MKLLYSLLCLLTTVPTVHADDYLYLYSKGKIQLRTLAEEVDSVAVVSKRILRIYDKDRQALYSGLLSAVDSIVIRSFGEENLPIADILDVRFNADGTAYDASPMQNTIQTKRIENISTYFHPVYNRYVARFRNTWGKIPSGYFKFDYENIPEVRQALANGHSLETVFMVDYEGTTYPTCKFFTSHENGGTGFSIPSATNGMSLAVNATTTNTSQYYWCYSKTKPVSRKYYHLVGIWDKEHQLSRLYINGKLAVTTPTAGELFFPPAGACWFGIGCDANTSEGSDAINGEVVMAKIYDKVLSADEVSALWENVSLQQQQNAEKDYDMVTRFDYLNNVPVKIGAKFDFRSVGLATGDKILLTDVKDFSYSWETTAERLNADSACFTIPNGFRSGRYRMELQRNGKVQDLGLVSLHVVDKMPALPAVAAHRCVWNESGSAQNSREGFRRTVARNLYCAEMDVWLTADNKLVVNHDATINGITIQTSNYDAIKNQKLSNGETLPTLAEMFDILVEAKNDTKILVEIKTHSSTARSTECVDSVVAMVRRYGLEKKIDYHAFSLAVCQRLVALTPQSNIGYLSKNLTPAQLAGYGINNMNYNVATYELNPAWVSQAQALGIKVNVWTPSDESRFVEMINQGVDVIGTDDTPELLRTLEYYKRHAKD